MVEELNTNNRINSSSPNHKSSQAATPKMLVHQQQQHHRLPHRTAAGNSLSKTANRSDQSNKAMLTEGAVPGEVSTRTATFARSTISSKQHFYRASDGTAIARTVADGSSKANAGVSGEPSDSQYAVASIAVPESTSSSGHVTRAGASSGNENILSTAAAESNNLQHNPDNGGLTTEAERSSSWTERAVSTVEETPHAATTKIHKKRSLLQMLPFFDTISDLDAHSAPTRRNTKRSERG
uniref:Uncharacterized protein n=1 Tax=Anopheles minimus TaxID=112268 RepID=A0A182W856_9DIPT